MSPGKTQGLCFSPGKSSGTVQHQGKEMQPGLQREGGKGSHTGGKAGTAPRRCVGSARVSQCVPATAKTRGMLLARLGAPRRPKTVVGKKEEGRRRRKIGTHTEDHQGLVTLVAADVCQAWYRCLVHIPAPRDDGKRGMAGAQLSSRDPPPVAKGKRRREKEEAKSQKRIKRGDSKGDQSPCAKREGSTFETTSFRCPILKKHLS